MPTILIRLDPSMLQVPDLDLRYDIPDSLTKRSAGLIIDGGYDYETPGDAMYIFLRTGDLVAALPHVFSLLESEPLHGNNLAAAAQVGASDSEVEEAVEFRIVYPKNASGTLRVRS